MNSPRNGTVTLIGPGVRIDGNITFAGYLRIQGDIFGNVRCDSDSSGTAVVHGAGSVTGSIATPNIVIGGRVQGPIRASGSIEIQDGAHVTGDADYRLLTIEPGAIIEGLLRSTETCGDGAPRLDRRIVASDAPELRTLDGPAAHHRRASDRIRSGGRIGGIASAVALAVGIGAWLSRDVNLFPPPDAVAANAPPTEPVLPAAPPEAAPPPTPAKAVLPPAAAVAPPPVAEPARIERVTRENPGPDAGKVITVEGMDAEKPAGIVFVKTREPAVLYVKSRSATGDGTRTELPERASRRFPMSGNDVLRVAQGRDLDIYYQGRKLSPAMVEGGQWLAFVPVAAGAATSSMAPITAVSPATPAVPGAGPRE